MREGMMSAWTGGRKGRSWLDAAAMACRSRFAMGDGEGMRTRRRCQ